jgi:RimJ/RimL family protein N-acetyltransferase
VEAKSTTNQKITGAFGLLTSEEMAAIEKANAKSEKFGALETERLLLREFVVNDIEGYYELESSGENARYQDWPPRTTDQARELVLANIETSCETPRTVWELIVESEGRMIGRVGAKLTCPIANPDPIGDSADTHTQNLPHFDLWFSFLPSVQGKGFATEAVKVFVAELVKGQTGELEFEIECDSRNTGSWKLAERLGFKKYSLTIRAWESKGEWVDSLVYRKVV